MKNFPELWREITKFKEIKYNDFISNERKFNKKCIIAPKYDGMLAALIYKKGEDLILQTKTGRIIKNDIPVKTELLEFLNKQKIDSIILIGELVAKVNNTILPFNKSQSIIKTPDKENNALLIHFYIFDILFINNKLITKYSESIVNLLNIFKKDLPHVHLTKFYFGTFNKIIEVYKEYQDQMGFDGIVVRELNSMKAIKIKYKSTLDLVVIGFGNKKMPSWPKKEISYLITAFIDKDGYFRLSSKVGTGFSRTDRLNFFNKLQEIKLYETDEEVFVRPKYIIEIEFSEEMLTVTPKYKFDNNKYIEIGKDKSLTLRHPSFIQIREDKEVNTYDVRPEQSPYFKY